MTFVLAYGIGYDDLRTRIGKGREKASDIISAVDDGGSGVKPVALGVVGIYPNPFNPSTSIEVSVPHDGTGELAIYTITGQRVRTLLDGGLHEGTHLFKWDGLDDDGAPVSSGVYLVRFRVGDMTSVRRVTLVK
ncbi:FlgD immunoglobulin-like domain containing protein [Candidatus Latescibacterota bacterium]